MNTRSLNEVLEKDLGPMTFGRFLRSARIGKDMSQTQMARFLGISRSTLCDIEKGRQLVSPKLAAIIAKRCGLSQIVAVETALTDQLKKSKLKMQVRVQLDEAA